VALEAGAEADARSEIANSAPAGEAGTPTAPAADDARIEADGAPRSVASALPAQGAAGSAGAAGVADLFGAVQVTRKADGGMVLEAPPEAAATLSALLAGMAQLFAQAAAPTRPGDARAVG
jgi:hypothetical protein